MNAPQACPSVLLLCDDLLWLSKIHATCQALGLRLRGARDLPRLREHLEAESPAAVLLDLDMANVEEAAAAVRTLHPAAQLLAFGSHVDTSGLAAARGAGCHGVYTRGQLAAELPAVLGRFAQPH